MKTQIVLEENEIAEAVSLLLARQGISHTNLVCEFRAEVDAHDTMRNFRCLAVAEISEAKPQPAAEGRTVKVQVGRDAD